MPELVLTTLKFVFLALLYLFIARAVRIIWLDIAGPRAPQQKPVAKPQQSWKASPVSKRSGAHARALIVNDDGGPPKTVPLAQQAVTLGRASECTMPLQDTYVSQMHTKIYLKDNVWHVEDLGSTNGTFLNRIKLSDPMPIAPGDEIRLGKTVVMVRGK